ncbi:hypothetical protein LPJ59_000726 [Coemansia sp. RSA 2399]|nr:hypothetical protein LPJ59_000726 [Coemansia sp. RSA 2399]KAJ1907706.1 hypothetical protein LPJ81_000589 [Coemansia sp. IMI 209127]
MAVRNLEEQQTARLNHLHTASRVAFQICPQLAAFYGNEFCSALGAQKVANSIARYQCPYCGSPLVDGRSVSRVSVVRSKQPQRDPVAKNCAAKPCGKNKVRLRRRQKQKSMSVDVRKRRVIKVWLSDTAGARQPNMTIEERGEARMSVKNTVEYICQLCDSRIVFPGATTSGLNAAGLSGDLTTTQTSSSIGLSKDTHAPAKTKYPVAPVSPKTKPGSVRIGTEANSPNNNNLASKRATSTIPIHNAAVTTAADSKMADSKMADAQTKKRKRYKSNLLATVAANKKKAEEKNNNSSFDLNDFLSSL